MADDVFLKAIDDLIERWEKDDTKSVAESRQESAGVIRRVIEQARITDVDRLCLQHQVGAMTEGADCIACFEAERHDATIDAYAVEAERAEVRTADLEGVLRSLASFLGAGGYNADTVDPAIFEEKIRWGIDHIIRVERERAIAKNGARISDTEMMSLLHRVNREFEIENGQLKERVADLEQVSKLCDAEIAKRQELDCQIFDLERRLELAKDTLLAAAACAHGAWRHTADFTTCQVEVCRTWNKALAQLGAPLAPREDDEPHPEFIRGYLKAADDLAEPYPADVSFFAPLTDEQIKTAVAAMGGDISGRLHAHWARHWADVLRKRSAEK